MAKLIIVITLTLLFSIVAVSFLGSDSGYVYIKIQDFNVEISLLLLVILIVFFTVAVHYLWQFANRTLNAKKDLKKWSHKNNLEKAHKKVSDGFIALGEGNYKKANKILSKVSNKTDYSLVALLGAASAAQQQGDDKSRNFLLDKALSDNPKAKLALKLTQADNMISLNKFEDAQAVLDELGRKVKNNSIALRIQSSIYANTNQFDKLLPMIKKLRTKTSINAEEIDRIEFKSYRHCLINAENNFEASKIWNRLPKKISENKIILLEYLDKLTYHNDYEKSASLLLDSLDKEWDEDLSLMYASLPLKNSARQITIVEKWIDDGHNSAKLNLALSKLYYNKDLWVMAKDKLLISIGLDNSIESQELLNMVEDRLLEHNS